MSYIKLIIGSDSTIPIDWANNPDSAFESLSDEIQSCFLLEQTAFMSFLKKLYGGTLPILLKNYEKNIKWYVDIINNKNNGTVSTTQEFKENVGYINAFISGNIPENYNDILRNLENACALENYPHPLGKTGISFYRPYLMYYGSNSNVSINEVVVLPTLSLRGRFIMACCDTKFIGYHYNQNIKTQLDNGPYPLSRDSIFSFLSGYNWKDYTFSAMLGILSSYCFDLDTTNVPGESNEMAFKLLKSVITGYRSSVSPYVDSLSLQFDDTSIRRILISFIINLRKLYGLKLEDAHVLAQLMGKDNKEDTSNLAMYLEATSASDVSVEKNKAFKNSIFSEFEELDISNRISKEGMSVSSSKPQLNAKDMSLLKETLKSILLSEAKVTGPAPLRNASKNAEESDTSSTVSGDLNIDDPKTVEKAKKTKKNAEDSLPDISEIDDAANGDVGATGEDDTSGTESDGDEDSSVTANPESEPNPNAEQGTQETPDTHIPDLPDVSDKKGVKLELSSSESTDTVFYRMELKTYINSILANPPEELSVEKLEILRKIKAYWINTLAPQCVHDILNTVIKLPKMFKIHKKKGK